MTKDPSDFMVEEYSQTNLHFFHLQDKIHEWFKIFIALYSVPFTVLAAVVGLGDMLEGIGLFSLPGVVAFLMLVIALLGFFVAMMIVSMRMEMILHKRAINDVRRYFAQLDQAESGISNFLVLPTSDRSPPFYELWRQSFWQILFIGFLDSFTLYFSIANLIGLRSWVLGVFSLGYWLLHWLAYWATAVRRERRFHSLHPEDLRPANY